MEMERKIMDKHLIDDLQLMLNKLIDNAKKAGITEQELDTIQWKLVHTDEELDDIFNGDYK